MRIHLTLKSLFFIFLITLITPSIISLSPTPITHPGGDLSSYEIMCFRSKGENITANLHIYVSSNLTAPELISPENGSEVKAGDFIVFRWTDVENATSYTLQLDKAENFSTPSLIEINDITDAEYILNSTILANDPPPVYRWYWRVCAVYEDGQKAYSSSWTIMIASETDGIEPIFTPFELIFAISVPVALVILAQIVKYKEKRKKTC